LTVSIFGVYDRFRSGLQTKQEPDDGVNLSSDPVLITVISMSVFEPNTTL